MSLSALLLIVLGVAVLGNTLKGNLAGKLTGAAASTSSSTASSKSSSSTSTSSTIVVAPSNNEGPQSGAGARQAAKNPTSGPTGSGGLDGSGAV